MKDRLEKLMQSSKNSFYLFLLVSLVFFIISSNYESNKEIIVKNKKYKAELTQQYIASIKEKELELTKIEKKIKKFQKHDNEQIKNAQNEITRIEDELSDNKEQLKKWNALPVEFMKAMGVEKYEKTIKDLKNKIEALTAEREKQKKIIELYSDNENNKELLELIDIKKDIDGNIQTMNDEYDSEIEMINKKTDELEKEMIDFKFQNVKISSTILFVFFPVVLWIIYLIFRIELFNLFDKIRNEKNNPGDEKFTLQYFPFILFYYNKANNKKDMFDGLLRQIVKYGALCIPFIINGFIVIKIFTKSIDICLDNNIFIEILLVIITILITYETISVVYSYISFEREMISEKNITDVGN